ncbi:hypothetical protein JAAARDRAFT_296359 [Jaapia argillacea MUCL 33604]|uniref:Uncharacterized protein n=1 Tax=Jaapia argillacea MUCL 33604 TaxID=933084 RepID=A0A067PZD6_9AGAM|nr:hypothetical protein JAAARDRAFT_296359 [Jaapia argillacea MUCL 33604]
MCGALMLTPWSPTTGSSDPPQTHVSEGRLENEMASQFAVSSSYFLSISHVTHRPTKLASQWLNTSNRSSSSSCRRSPTK